MSNVFKQLRSTTTNTPVSLPEGQLAFSEDASPNGLNELFIGTSGSTITKITTDNASARGGTAAAPNDTAQDNQTITTGTGLDGADAGSTGNVTLTLDLSELPDMTAAVDGSLDELILLDNGAQHRKLISEINLSQFNDDLGAGGDITRVNITAGTGLTGSVDTTSGDHTQTLSFDFSTLTDKTTDIAGTTEFIIQDGVTESRKAASEIKLSNFNNDSGWTSNAGTVTDVTGGTGVTSTGGATPSIGLDFSELTDMTGNISGTTEFIIQDGVTESRKAASEIQLSFFNNDSGWEANDPNEVLTTDTGSASWNWIIDEDAMGSNSAAHVPTQQSVKAYVDNAVTGALTHKGGYNAATNTPPLDTGSPSITIGDMYTVTAAGTFFTVDVEVGDVLIADVTSSDAAALSDWTIVQKNIGQATETEAGYIQIATAAEVAANTDDTVAITPAKLSSIDTLGTIATGTWQADVIAEAYLQNQSGTNTGDEPDASETVKGIIEIATQAEVDAGSSALLAVTPQYLHNTVFDAGTF